MPFSYHHSIPSFLIQGKKGCVVGVSAPPCACDSAGLFLTVADHLFWGLDYYFPSDRTLAIVPQDAFNE